MFALLYSQSCLMDSIWIKPSFWACFLTTLRFHYWTSCGGWWLLSFSHQPGGICQSQLTRHWSEVGTISLCTPIQLLLNSGFIHPFFPSWSTSAPNLRRRLLFTPSSVSEEQILKSVKVWNSSLASRGGPERQAFAKLVVLLGPWLLVVPKWLQWIA